MHMRVRAGTVLSGFVGNSYLPVCDLAVACGGAQVVHPAGVVEMGSESASAHRCVHYTVVIRYRPGRRRDQDRAEDRRREYVRRAAVLVAGPHGGRCE